MRTWRFFTRRQRCLDHAVSHQRRTDRFYWHNHEDLPFALEEIALDEDNRAMILTGTGDVFMDQIDGPSLGDFSKPIQFERTRTQGIKILQRFASLPFPVVGVANGAATVHSEYPSD